MTLLRDTLLIFRRQLSLSARNPVWVVFGLSQPAVFLIFYGPVMTRMLGTSGTPRGQVWQVYVPGVLVQLGLFGAAFVGMTIVAEWRAGVLERLRITPVSRLALLLGRVLRDVVVIVIQATLLLLIALPFGLRVTPGGALLGLVFVALLTVSLASLSYTLGLLLKSEEAMTPVLNSALMPLLLLSGVLLPMSLAPVWLDDVSRITPVRYLVEAMRDEFAGQFTATPVIEGAAVAIGLGAVSLALGTWTFLRQNA